MNTVSRASCARCYPPPSETALREGETSVQHEVVGCRTLRMSEFLDQRHNQTLTIGEAIERFLETLKIRIEVGEIRPTTFRTHNSQLKNVSEALRRRPVTALRRAEVIDWHRQLARRVHPSGRRLTGAADGALASLSSVFSWLDHEDILGSPIVNPARNVRRLHRSSGARPFSDIELQRFRDAIEIHEHAKTRRVRGLRKGHPKLVRAYSPTVALRVLDLVGMRPSEVRTLRRSQVNFDRRIILLDETKTDEGLARPLSSRACEVLQYHFARLDDAGEWVFPGWSSPFLSRNSLTGCFDRVCRVAGLTGFSPYSCRHTYITGGFAEGCTGEEVSSAAGNTPRVAHRHYRHALPAGAWRVAEQHSLPKERAA